MDRGAWSAAVQGVAKGQIQLSNPRTPTTLGIIPSFRHGWLELPQDRGLPLMKLVLRGGPQQIKKMKELTSHHGLYSVTHSFIPQIFIAHLLCANHYYPCRLEIQQTEQDRRKAPASLMCMFSLGRQMIKMEINKEEKRHLEITAANKQGEGWKMNGRRSSYGKVCVCVCVCVCVRTQSRW